MLIPSKANALNDIFPVFTAAYAKGAAETLVGNVTGSDEWKQAGEQIKSEATDAIRQAADNRQPADDATLAGKAEKAAEQGEWTGCL